MSTIWPAVEFMASPAAAAATRYSFNSSDGSAYVLGDNTLDLGDPELEGNPDGIDVDYGLRTLTFTHRIYGTKVAALAKQSLVARELQRNDNWLMVQVSVDTDPVWFHTYKAGAVLSFEHVQDRDAGRDAWDVRLTLPAEAFAYGERVVLSTATITNDPSSGTNKMSLTLPAVIGDAPAPLRIRIDPSNANFMDGFRFGFSVLAALDVPTVPIVWQVGGTDGWTIGTDTSASTADAAMSGGTRRRVSFATDNNLTTRLNGNAPAALAAGTYKVFVRVARSDTASTFALRFGQGLVFSYWFNDTVLFAREASSTSNHATWVDLGEMTHPRRHQAPDGQYGIAGIPDIALQAQRLTGAGSLDIDAFMLVPLDVEGAIESRTMFVEFPVSGPASGSSVFTYFDGDLEFIWGFNSAGTAHPLTPEIEGSFPRVIPGAEHIFHLFQQVNARRPFLLADTPDVITFTCGVELSYQPRWRWVGAG